MVPYIEDRICPPWAPPPIQRILAGNVALPWLAENCREVAFLLGRDARPDAWSGAPGTERRTPSRVDVQLRARHGHVARGGSRASQARAGSCAQQYRTD